MILVTGGTGFMGSHLLQQLVAENQPVKAIFRHNSNFDLVKNIKHKIEWCNADLMDLHNLNEALMKFIMRLLWFHFSQRTTLK